MSIAKKQRWDFAWIPFSSHASDAIIYERGKVRFIELMGHDSVIKQRKQLIIMVDCFCSTNGQDRFRFDEVTLLSLNSTYAIIYITLIAR